jgi:hypothetical protein
MTVSDLLEQPCNKSDNAIKLVTACSKLVDNLGQAVRTQLVDSLLPDLLQDVRLCVCTMAETLRDYISLSSRVNLFSVSAMLSQSPLEFEKDDDSNGHIDYITACSVCL